MTPSLLPMSSLPVVAAQPPRLLDQVAQAARQRGASQPATAQLVSCVRAFVLFHGKRHPRELGLPTVTRFLEHVHVAWETAARSPGRVPLLPPPCHDSQAERPGTDALGRHAER